MRIAIALLTSLLVLTLPVTVLGQSDSSPSPIPRVAPSTFPEPSASPPPQRPILSPPVERPEGPRPRLKTRRPPDAAIEKRGVRLELWVPRKRVRSGEFLPATMRVTNLRAGTISHGGSLECHDGPPSAKLDVAGLFDAGVEQQGRAERFKQQFLRASRMSRFPMWPNGPRADDCPGSVGHWENIAPGRSFTVPVAVYVRYPWRDQPLPSGSTTVTAHYRFSTGLNDQGAVIDLETSAPVRIKGQPVEYPSPQDLADAALAHPEFRAWVDSRWKNADFSPNVHVIDSGRKTWAERGFTGGPAPEETIKIGAQAGGKTRAWLRTLRIDPWTATIEEVDL